MLFRAVLQLEHGGLDAAVFVDKVVDKVPRLLVLQLRLRHARLGEEFVQLGVDVLQVEALVRVPAHVADVLEVGGQRDVFLPQLNPGRLLLAGLLAAELLGSLSSSSAGAGAELREAVLRHGRQGRRHSRHRGRRWRHRRWPSRA